MAGCYGNHPEDRHFERMLDKYLMESDEDAQEGVDDLADQLHDALDEEKDDGQ